MSDRAASWLGLALVALASAALLVLEWALAVAWLRGGGVSGWAMLALALASSALLGWLALDVWRSPSPAE